MKKYEIRYEVTIKSPVLTDPLVENRTLVICVDSFYAALKVAQDLAKRAMADSLSCVIISIKPAPAVGRYANA
jgi:hypothetical protein